MITQSCRKSVKPPTLCLWLFLVAGGSLLAKPLPNQSVLIVNSNKTVARYALTQSEFEKAFSVPYNHVDLGDPRFGSGELEEVIFRTDPDVIFCIGSKAYTFVYQLAPKRQIVFASVFNWRRFPLGPNTYGVSNETEPGFDLTLYRFLFPDLGKLGVIYSPRLNRTRIDDAKSRADEVAIRLVAKDVARSSQVIPALKRLTEEVEALWLISDPVVLSDLEQVKSIFNTVDVKTLPVFSYNTGLVEFDPVLIIDADIPTSSLQAAILVKDLLAGKKPEKKVLDPVGTHIVLNLKQVEKLGLNLNPEALDSVNEFIE